MKYEIADKFVLRTPMFTVEEYKNITDSNCSIEKKMEYLLNNNLFMEGIAIASPELYGIIQKNRYNVSLFSDSKIYYSLLKYAIRACTRTTPFGLFSGISFGEFGDRTEITLDKYEEHIKRARIDMEWLGKVVTVLEHDLNFMENITIYSNRMIYRKGERLINPCTINQNYLGRDSKNLVVSIKETELLNMILRLCENGMTYSQMVSEVKNIYSEISNEKIKNYLQELVYNGFLLSELRASKSNIDPLYNLKRCLKKSNSCIINVDIISKLERMISEYNNTIPGEGIDLLREIEFLMKEICTVKNYIQVDYKTNTKTCILNKQIKEKCESFIEELVLLGTAMPEVEYLKRYKQCFLEKYGNYREVPVLDLLDEEKGIGAPDSYTLPKNKSSVVNISSTKSDLFKNELRQMVIDKILWAIKYKQNQITIINEDLISIKNKFEDIGKANIPVSLDMFIFIYAKSMEDMDKGDYEIALAPSIGADYAGRTVSRFSDMLDIDEEKAYMNLLAESKKGIESNYIYADIVEEPLQGRIGNIILNKNNAEYQTALGCVGDENVKQIDIKDVLVGIDSSTNEFYLKSYSLNKRIRYVAFNMLNTVLASNVHRFLREISSMSNLKFIRVIREFLLQEFVYVPQIKLLDCIIVPETWNLSFKRIGNIQNYNDFIGQFKMWKNKWDVPQYIYYKKGDDLFKMDLNDENMLKDLYKILKKTDNVELIKCEEENSWVKNVQDESFCSEFIFSAYRSSNSNEKNNSDDKTLLTNINKSSSFVREQQRISLSGEDGWWYFKLYSTDLDSLIYERILPFCKENQKKDIIEEFYFIRYADPALHVRLRVRLKNNNYNLLFFKWIKSLHEINVIKEYSVNIYERELERYGGEKTFKYIEKFFYYDSLYVAELLGVKRTDDINEKLVVMNNLCILKEFTTDYNELLKMFESSYRNLSAYKKEFKKELKNYIFLYEYLDDMTVIDLMKIEKKKQKEIKKLLKIRNQKLREFIFELKQCEEAGLLTNTLNDIIFSIMHMHCNRFNGNRVWEHKTIELTYRTIYAYKNYKLKRVEKKYEGC